ncbi:MAG: SH3 domain-containing protein [Thermoanaerobaculia bacterium]
MPIATEYVRGASLPIHAQPAEASPVVTTYQNGEAVSVLTRHDGWIEVRTVSGSGWVLASELSSAAEASKVESDNTTARFIRAPEPMAEPNAHGDIVLEAQVNSEGDVMSVRTMRNSTGLIGLEARTAAALQKAKFAPMVQHGNRLPFVYEHRVHY